MNLTPFFGKDFVAILVTALMAAGNVANPILVFVITLAVKRGLDKMCSA
ncbi:hypothetical protein [Luteimonas arsenica]|nr:hypothetical protein [Luteimonas arsenica]